MPAYAPKLAINYSFWDNSMGAFTKPGAIWVLSPTYIKVRYNTSYRNLWPFNWAVTRAYVQYPRSTSALSHTHPCTRPAVCRCEFRYSQAFVRYLKCFELCFFSFLVPVPLGPAVITHHAGTKTAPVGICSPSQRCLDGMPTNVSKSRGVSGSSGFSLTFLQPGLSRLTSTSISLKFSEELNPKNSIATF